MNVVFGAVRGSSWIQGLAAREEDVDKDKAIAIAANALKDEHQRSIAANGFVIIAAIF